MTKVISVLRVTVNDEEPEIFYRMRTLGNYIAALPKEEVLTIEVEQITAKEVSCH